MISTIDIAWAAGFIEGEGCFGTTNSIKLEVAQKHKPPLDKLQILFGGNITKSNTRDIWIWRISAQKTAEVSMTIYLLMSPKRQKEIEKILNHWAKAPIRIKLKDVKENTLCRENKHRLLEGDNLWTYKEYVRCRACSNEKKRIARIEGRWPSDNKSYVKPNLSNAEINQLYVALGLK